MNLNRLRELAGIETILEMAAPKPASRTGLKQAITKRNDIVTLSIIIEDLIAETVVGKQPSFRYADPEGTKTVSLQDGIAELDEVGQGYTELEQEYPAAKQQFIQAVNGRTGTFVTWAVEYDIQLSFIPDEQAQPVV